MTDSRWVSAIARDALEPQDVTPVTIENRGYLIYDAPDGLYASSARCSHGGAFLGDGYFDGYVIECPLHQGCFDIRSGEACGLPATRSIRVYDTRVLDGMVEIDLQSKR